MLELRSVNAGYGTFPALFDVNLDVKAGEAVGVIGPNGAGKTTLMRVISGLIRPSRGAIAMEGVDVLGIMDDDRLTVGNADNSPWTFYIMADVADLDTAVAVCNLYRTTPVGEYNLWRYGKIEARVGRALAVPPAATA